MATTRDQGWTDATRRRPVLIGLALSLLLGASALVTTAVPAAPATSGWSVAGKLGGKQWAPGVLMVRFKAGVTPAAAESVNARLGTSTIRVFHIVPNLYLIKLPAQLGVLQAASAYRTSPLVQYAEPDFVSRIDDTIPNDPSFNLEWDWLNTGQIGGTAGDDVDAVKAWDLTTGSSDVAVGLLDTGVQIDPHLHPDQAANIWSNAPECNGIPGVDDDGNGYVDDCHGIDTINHDSDPNDDYGHGVHVAGTMGAVGNNGIGVTGMNWSVTIVPCKSHDNTGNGTNDSLIECLQYMQTEKAAGYNIVATNNSYGGCLEACDYSQSLYDAIKGQMDSGILYVAAAGNDAANNDVTPKYPTNYYLPNVIGVAATTNTDSLAAFSNWGLHTVYVGAPGQSIWSTYLNDGYAYLSGTSMASPHVTGLAALIAAYNPSLDWRAIRNLILAGGEVVTALQGKTVTGRRINAYGSLTCSNVAVFGPLRPLPNSIGGTQPLSADNIDCASPAGPLTVTITPGGQTLKLRDDGKGQDLMRADGIYSAAWTPCATGTYTLTYSNGAIDTTTVTGLVPCITVKPKSGPPGSTTTVKGSGFSPNESVTISFDDTVVATATANGNGVFQKQITIPGGSSHGRHTVTALGAVSLLATEASFNVT